MRIPWIWDQPSGEQIFDDEDYWLIPSGKPDDEEDTVHHVPAAANGVSISMTEPKGTNGTVLTSI